MLEIATLELCGGLCVRTSDRLCDIIIKGDVKGDVGSKTTCGIAIDP